jgi:hypothetical protein
MEVAETVMTRRRLQREEEDKGVTAVVRRRR